MTGRYSDGPIEDELLAIVDANEKNYHKILTQDTRWPVLYHLSDERRNLLEWYPFDSRGSLLEIGAGCGALTGLFCDRLRSVHAVELMKKRADILRKRWKRDNLKVSVANINRMATSEKYDYVTLIGVLEYAKGFTEGKNRSLAFLRRVSEFLAEDGELIIAIENRFGLKYFAGAKEEHTFRLFDGIEGYPSTESIETYGKEEIIKLLKDAGFSSLYFYYPYPDYKLPGQIFCDDYLPTESSCLEGSKSFDADRIQLFNEKRAIKYLLRNRKFDFFANSFLIVAKKGYFEPNAIYAKYNRFRKDGFQTETCILRAENSLQVRKRCLMKAGERHIQNMIKTCERVRERALKTGLGVPRIISHDNMSVTFEYITGETLADRFVAAYYEDNLELLTNIIKAFEKIVRENFLEKHRGSGLIRNEVDLTLDNIIQNKQGYFLIDIEPFFNSLVPVKFMLFRAIYLIYNNRIRGMEKPAGIRMESLFDRASITPEEAKKFAQMEDEMQKIVLGKNKDNYYFDRYLKKSVECGNAGFDQHMLEELKRKDRELEEKEKMIQMLARECEKRLEIIREFERNKKKKWYEKLLRRH